MKERTTFIGLCVLCLSLAMGGSAQAATEDSITVTVSLASVISVSVTPDTWAIGAIALSSVTGPETFTAEVGNTATKLEIKGADGAGGWTIGTPEAEDVFEVAVDDPAITLTAAYQQLSASVAAYGSEAFDLTYSAPTGDTIGGGVAQGFAITVKASAP